MTTAMYIRNKNTFQSKLDPYVKRTLMQLEYLHKYFEKRPHILVISEEPSPLAPHHLEKSYGQIFG